ncbi:hypothetical protein [Aliiglaciecola sp. LCG003]|uniref:hypothetical protein n=1 Tax=Aliiglaciecola sp. LCG003 TaxID=3053655 RepID=UPI002572C531|nr:hypothetical protein [Aliiglaciecola sp. LCG003]WJG10738.1 hypothetical protein QR722_06775 [Aliiglaciecola sp. LCG003]
MSSWFSPLYYVLVFTLSCALSGCVNSPTHTLEQKAQIQAHDEIIEQAEQFVHSNLYTGMIHVWSVDRRAWNLLLSAYSCGVDNNLEQLTQSYQTNQPVFADAMAILASHQATFSSDAEKAALYDVSQLAYRLFSASYAKGYARQVKLADELSPGLREELCGGQLYQDSSEFLDYPQDLAWRSFQEDFLATNNQLALHAQNGYKAFNILLQKQYEQFDALVYSHAYQQTDDYETLFFEVNKYENVQSYGQQVTKLSSMRNHVIAEAQQNDFAYLVLSSGYHWGMMSVLAMIEEEYPLLHDEKKRQGRAEIGNVRSKISINSK